MCARSFIETKNNNVRQANKLFGSDANFKRLGRRAISQNSEEM
jgi:hypothetical protein